MHQVVRAGLTHPGGQRLGNPEGDRHFGNLGCCVPEGGSGVVLLQIVSRHRSKCHRGCRALGTRNDFGPGVSGIPGTHARTGIVLTIGNNPVRRSGSSRGAGYPDRCDCEAHGGCGRPGEAAVHLWVSPVHPPTVSRIAVGPSMSTARFLRLAKRLRPHPAPARDSPFLVPSHGICRRSSTSSEPAPFADARHAIVLEGYVPKPRGIGTQELAGARNTPAVQLDRRTAWAASAGERQPVINGCQRPPR